MTTFRQWLAESADWTTEREEGFEVFLRNEHKDLDAEFDEDKIGQFEDAYHGCHWASFKEFAQEMFDDIVEVPDHLTNYIDYDAVARDWKHNYWESDGHIFRNF